MEANNLMCFSAWNAGLLVNAHTATSARSPWSVALRPPATHAATVRGALVGPLFSAIECLSFLSLVRGQAALAYSYANLALELVQDQINRNAPLVKNCYQVEIARAYSMSALALTAKSSDTADRDLASDRRRLARDIYKELAEADEPPDISMLLGFALHCVSLGQLDSACGYFHEAAQVGRVDGDRSRQCLALAGCAWSAFLAGHRSSAQASLDAVLDFSVSTSHVALHLWALELDIIMKIFVGDLEGAEESQRLMRLLGKRGDPSESEIRKEQYNASSSAVVAYFFVAKGDFERACPLAAYAGMKLASKKQGTALGGVVLFLAGYATLEILQWRDNGGLQRLSSGRTSGNSASYTGKKSLAYMRSKNFSRMRAHGSNLTTNKQLLANVKSVLASLTDHSLRYPCLGSLTWALTAKLQRYEKTISLKTLISTDFCIKESRASYVQFVFAEAYLKLERAHLCHALRRDGLDLSVVAAKACFDRMGGCPHELCLFANVPSMCPVFKDEADIDSNGSALEDNYDES